MNTNAELKQTFAEYKRTQFGGWPWDSPAPINEKNTKRFASTILGGIEYPTDR